MTSAHNFETNGGKPLVDFLNQKFETIGDWAFDHKWLVLLLCLLVLGIGGFFSWQVRFDNSFNAYFDENDPTYQNFLDFREEFGSDEISYIVYSAPEAVHNIWNLDVMGRIRDLSEQLKTVPFVEEVTTLANAEFIEGVEGELLVHEILDEFPDTQAELLALKEKIVNKPIYVDGLVSADEKFGAIILEMEKASIDPLEEIRFDPAKGDKLDNLYPQVTYDAIEEILARPEYVDIQFYHTGDVPLNAHYNRISQTESTRLGLISFIVVGLLLVFFFRNFIGVSGPLLLVLCSILVTTGFVGLMGWDFDLMFIMLAPLLVAVGVADSVHLLSEFHIYYNWTGDRRQAIKKTLHLVGVPCLFTSLTTMAGFASMSVSSIKAIRHFAIYSSVGVGAAFLLTITFLVVFLSMGKKKVRTQDAAPPVPGERFLVTILAAVSRFDIRMKWPILILSAVVFVVSAVGITRLKVDSNFITEFSKKTHIRQVTEYVDSIMGGSLGFSYVFDTGEADGVTAPAVLKEIEELQKRAGQQKVVMKTYSVADMIKDINREFHNGDDAYYRIPESPQAAAQLLLVYEMAGGEELSDYLNGDFSRARLEMRTKAVETSRYKEMVNELDGFLQANTALAEVPSLAGMGTLWLRLLDYIVSSQFIGFALAFCVIAVMMCLVLGSVRVGLLSMIPNLTPVIITLGVMGWLGIHLDYVKLLIGCVAIGIAVDDTVHMIVRYRHEFLRCGNYREALLNAMKDVGRALFITSVVLVAGFLVCVFSTMSTLSDFGLLVACTIFVALIADFFLLPALVMGTRAFGPERPEAGTVSSRMI